MPTLYYLPGAVCAQKALMTIALKGSLDRIEAKAITREDLATPEYLKLNPKAVVPTLVDDEGNAITESSTIMRFVDEAYEGRSLQPGSLLERCRMNNWMKYMDEDLFPAAGFFTMATLLRPDLQHVPEDVLYARLRRSAGVAVGAMRLDAVRDGVASQAVSGAIELWEKCFASMDERLADHEWLAGDAISLADIALAPAFVRLQDLGLAPWWQTRSAPVARWWARVEGELYAARFHELFPNPMSERLHETGGELRAMILEAEPV